MEDRQPMCPYCEKDMERGFVLDFAHGAVVNSTWQPGAPEPKKLLGLKTGSVQMKPDDMVAVTTYRCLDCGYLESYARRQDS